VITQHVVQPIKRAPVKPAKATLLSRLKGYAKALSNPLRLSSLMAPKPPRIEWAAQSWTCGTPFVQAPGKWSDDVRKLVLDNFDEGLPELLENLEKGLPALPEKGK